MRDADRKATCGAASNLHPCPAHRLRAKQTAMNALGGGPSTPNTDPPRVASDASRHRGLSGLDPARLYTNAPGTVAKQPHAEPFGDALAAKRLRADVTAPTYPLSALTRPLHHSSPSSPELSPGRMRSRARADAVGPAQALLHHTHATPRTTPSPQVPPHVSRNSDLAGSEYVSTATTPLVLPADTQLALFAQRMPAKLRGIIDVFRVPGCDIDPHRLSLCLDFIDCFVAEDKYLRAEEPSIVPVEISLFAETLTNCPALVLQQAKALYLALSKSPKRPLPFAWLNELLATLTLAGTDTLAHIFALSRAQPQYDGRMAPKAAHQLVGLIDFLNRTCVDERASLASQIVLCATQLVDVECNLDGLTDLGEALAQQPVAARADCVAHLCQLPALELVHAASVLVTLQQMPPSTWNGLWQQACTFEDAVRVNLANRHVNAFYQQIGLPTPDINFADERLVFLALSCAEIPTLEADGAAFRRAVVRMGQLGNLRFHWATLLQQSSQQRQRLILELNLPQGAAGRARTPPWASQTTAVSPPNRTAPE